MVVKTQFLSSLAAIKDKIGSFKNITVNPVQANTIKTMKTCQPDFSSHLFFNFSNICFDFVQR